MSTILQCLFRRSAVWWSLCKSALEMKEMQVSEIDGDGEQTKTWTSCDIVLTYT